MRIFKKSYKRGDEHIIKKLNISTKTIWPAIVKCYRVRRYFYHNAKKTDQVKNPKWRMSSYFRSCVFKTLENNLQSNIIICHPRRAFVCFNKNLLFSFFNFSLQKINPFTFLHLPIFLFLGYLSSQYVEYSE